MMDEHLTTSSSLGTHPRRVPEQEPPLLSTAADEALPDGLRSLVLRSYDDLRRVAQSQLSRERRDHTLQATAVVHEAYLSLFGRQPLRFRDRGHFLAFMSRVMRRVLVEHARYRGAERRGGGWQKLALEEWRWGAPEPPFDIEGLVDALRALAKRQPQRATLIELRFFAGLTLDEAAAALGASRATVVREWRAARRWLRRELE